MPPLLFPRLASLLQWACLTGPWVLLFERLRGEWSVNPQYSFGWFVPPLAILLAWRRWFTRPEPAPTVHGGTSFWITITLLGLTLLPLRVLLEANGEWRLANIALAIIVLGLTLLVVHRAGGRPWLGHFAFPALFPLLAVPWPARIETPLTQGLMESVTAITVDALNWLGIACVQQGSVIEMVSGFVGIEEACSGIRSLHATLMVALLLGEWSRLGPRHRASLVVLGLPLALAMNFLRSFSLAWIAARHGPSAVEGWHDPAGFTVLIPCFAVLGWLSARWETPPPSPPSPLPSRSPRRIPALAAAAGLAWLIAVEVLTGAWYRAHERDLPPSPSWTLDWSRAPGIVRPMEIPRRIRERMHCDELQAGEIRTPDGQTWQVHLFHWSAGQDVSRISDLHVPEGCLPSAGWRLDHVGTPLTLSSGQLRLPCLPYRFTREGRPLALFLCRWETAPGRLPELEFTHRNRWRAAIEGRRHLGLQILQATSDGEGEMAAAALAFQKLVGPMLVERR